MSDSLHSFHIPVMGTGHSVDTPIRLAPLGITSVISIIDDILLERIRKYYCEEYDLPFEYVSPRDIDGRAKRITAYLDTVHDIVQIKMNKIRDLPFFEKNEKTRYFELLPESSTLKQAYNKLMEMKAGSFRDKISQELTQRMQPGSIDVNIMAKVDRMHTDKHGNMLSEEYSDAKAALRGYAESKVKSAMIFSAGINQSLFSYMTKYRDFYRDHQGELKRKIVLKVSDFRSAMIQGRFMAKKGLEISEFRIESGLNCGGHAFASPGHLLPVLLQEFKEKRKELSAHFQPMIHRFYEKMGWEYPSDVSHEPEITVQGGIGTHGEVQRLEKDFNIDKTGWASPFLLVPEATPVDDVTRVQLAKATESDLYLSDASPLGIPFNNLRSSGSENWTKQRAEEGRPGSSCPKGFLISNTEFGDTPICTASSEYLNQKLEVVNTTFSRDEREKALPKIMAKSCLCDHLGNGALISLGIAPPERSPQAICPGPNLAWFNRNYTLEEMIDHIYGRGESIVPENRPHMFAKEIELYVSYFQRLVDESSDTQKEIQYLNTFHDNLLNGFSLCADIAGRKPFEGENLASIDSTIKIQRKRLDDTFTAFRDRLSLHSE